MLRIVAEIRSWLYLWCLNLTPEPHDRLRAILPHSDEKPLGCKRADMVKVFLGILRVLESGARGTGLDKSKSVSFQTCHRNFQEGVEDGTFERALETLVRHAEDEGLIVFLSCGRKRGR